MSRALFLGANSSSHGRAGSNSGGGGNSSRGNSTHGGYVSPNVPGAATGENDTSTMSYVSI